MAAEDAEVERFVAFMRRRRPEILLADPSLPPRAVSLMILKEWDELRGYISGECETDAQDGSVDGGTINNIALKNHTNDATAATTDDE
ncbi:hypothetical protein FOZ60_010570 [Perkinsus olseni]|uniref:Uncharacterized protein n=1 Tax=Perkinsus olseni TaxID=32597 RepID=A0A7J6NF16_PEROL|nr:hypothetical protein FOZ60_010570 [Perkinsus olseni]